VGSELKAGIEFMWHPFPGFSGVVLGVSILVVTRLLAYFTKKKEIEAYKRRIRALSVRFIQVVLSLLANQREATNAN
jgi:hypothetical protein